MTYLAAGSGLANNAARLRRRGLRRLLLHLHRGLGRRRLDLNLDDLVCRRLDGRRRVLAAVAVPVGRRRRPRRRSTVTAADLAPRPNEANAVEQQNFYAGG